MAERRQHGQHHTTKITINWELACSFTGLVYYRHHLEHSDRQTWCWTSSWECFILIHRQLEEWEREREADRQRARQRQRHTERVCAYLRLWKPQSPLPVTYLLQKIYAYSNKTTPPILQNNLPLGTKRAIYDPMGTIKIQTATKGVIYTFYM